MDSQHLQPQTPSRPDRTDHKIARGLIRGVNGVITTIEELVLFLLLLFGLYAIWDNQQIDNENAASQYEMYKPVAEDSRTFDDFQNVNPDVCGWLTIDDTGIDYPLVQGPDNDTYMNTTPDLQFALSGSLFLDYRNANDFSDFNTIIYGHHMEGNSMFGELDQYEDAVFFQNHQKGELYCNGEWHDLQVYAFVEADAYDSGIYSIVRGQKEAAIGAADNNSTDSANAGAGSGTADGRTDSVSADVNAGAGNKEAADNPEATEAAAADAEAEAAAEDARAAYRDYIQSLALQYRDVGVTTADHLVVMSTCMTDTTNGRYLLIARIGDPVSAPASDTQTVHRSGLRLTSSSEADEQAAIHEQARYVFGFLFLAIVLFIVSRITRHYRNKKRKLQEM